MGHCLGPSVPVPASSEYPPRLQVTKRDHPPTLGQNGPRRKANFLGPPIFAAGIGWLRDGMTTTPSRPFRQTWHECPLQLSGAQMRTGRKPSQAVSSVLGPNGRLREAVQLGWMAAMVLERITVVRPSGA